MYFRPSLGAALGRTLLLPDCDALLAQQPPSHLRVYKIYPIRQALSKNYFWPRCGNWWNTQKPNKTAEFLQKKPRQTFSCSSIFARDSSDRNPRGRHRHKALGRVSGASLALLSISDSIEGPKRCFSKGFGRTDQGDQLAIAGDADRFAARGAPDQFRKLLSCFVQTDHSHVSSLSSDDSHLRKECLPS